MGCACGLRFPCGYGGRRAAFPSVCVAQEGRLQAAGGGVIELVRTSAAEAWARRTTLRLVALGRYPKRAILVANDLILFNLALWLAMSTRLGELYFPATWEMFVVLAAAPFIGVATFFQAARLPAGDALHRRARALS